MESVKTKEAGIPGSTLKIIAIVAMFIDHFGAMVLEMYMKNAVPNFMDELEADAWYAAHPTYEAVVLIDALLRLIGRFGFPIFCFLLVEGFEHTRSVKKYALNMALFALISEIPFDLALENTWLEFGYQNVYFTLLIGLLTLAGMKKLAEQEAGKKVWKMIFYPSAFLLGAMVAYLINSRGAGISLPRMFYQVWVDTNMAQRFSLAANVSALIAWYLLGAVIGGILLTILAVRWTEEQRIYFAKVVPVITLGILLADWLHTDYSGYGVLTIVVMYLARKDKLKKMFWGCAVLTYMSFMEATAFLMMIPVKKYNGKRGISMKYFFYAFYPGHILFMYVLARILGFVA